MKKIKLNKSKGEIVLAIISFILCGLFIYLATKGNIKLKISGAKIDSSTSSIFLYIFSIPLLIAGINLAIQFFSVLKYGDFILEITEDKITFPKNYFFNGWKKITIKKEKVHKVIPISKGKGAIDICLQDKQNKTLGSIPGYLAYKTIKPQELANLIQQWLTQDIETL